MEARIVRALVPESSRARYLEAWQEWSGTLFPMGIETRLLEHAEERGRFIEVTWFGPGERAAVGDDRLVAADRELRAAAAEREGAHEFWSEVSEPEPGGT